MSGGRDIRTRPIFAGCGVLIPIGDVFHRDWCRRFGHDRRWKSSGISRGTPRTRLIDRLPLTAKKAEMRSVDGDVTFCASGMRGELRALQDRTKSPPAILSPGLERYRGAFHFGPHPADPIGLRVQRGDPQVSCVQDTIRSGKLPAHMVSHSETQMQMMAGNRGRHSRSLRKLLLVQR